MGRILHVDNSTHFTGAFKALLSVGEQIRVHYSTLIALPSKSACTVVLKSEGVDYVEFKFIEIRKEIFNLVAYFPMLFYNAIKLVRLVREYDISVIHANDHFNMVPVLAKIILGSKVMLITHVRLLPGTYNSALYSIFKAINLRIPDLLIGVSQAVHAAYDNTPKMITVHDKIYLKEKHPPFICRARSPIQMVYVSNYIEGKGQNIALNAFLILQERMPETELHFYGGTMGLKKNIEFLEGLKLKSQQRGMEFKVFFHDFAADTEVVYKEADISLCFSESESFSLVCIESMFYGVPMIASMCGGPEEIIESGINGLLVPNRDVVAMASAMELLVSDISLRRKFSTAGKIRVCEINRESTEFLQLIERTKS